MDGPRSFYCFDRGARPKKAGIFFNLRVGNASCAPNLAMKRPLQCEVSRTVLQTKMEFFSEQRCDDQFVIPAGENRFAIAH
jgi:hypothetical protein